MSVQLLDLTHFSDLYNVIPDAVLFVNSAGTILQANEQASLLFGYGREELVGESI